MSLRKLVLSSLLSLSLFTPRAHAVESIQLEHVPVDATEGCERVFFKSSQNFTGTIYALPIVIPATDEYGETIMTTDVDANRGSGNYLLNFQLYFPNDDKAMREHSPPDVAPKLPKCDFAVVKESLNAHLPENEKIHTIAYMPLTSIEVSIPEYLNANESFLIGQKKDAAEADLITYQGATFNITMRMNETEKSAVLNALTRKEGLQARVRMRFKAHKQNGALKVNLDMSQLALSFKAAAKGEAYMVQADIQAALKMAMSEQNLSIKIQEGSSDSFNDLVKQILAKVLEEIKLIPEAAIEDREAKAIDSEKKKISVAIVADVLSKKITSSFNVVNSSAEEVATAEVAVPLQATLNDPNIRVMRVASGEPLEPTLSEEIHQGDTFSITGSHYVLETNEYQEQISFVTASDLRTNYVELDPVASLLTNRHFTVSGVERNGVSLAVGSWSWYYITDWGHETIWKRVERIPVLVRNPKVRMENDKASYSRFPVYATFSLVGGQRKMFPFSDLMSSNSYWDGYYDFETGSIVVTAKKDLGLMALRPRFKLNENNDRADYDTSLMNECDKLDGQKKMNCYFPKCASLDPEKVVIDNMDVPCTSENQVVTHHPRATNTQVTCKAMNDTEYAQKLKEEREKIAQKRSECISVDHQRMTVAVEQLIEEQSDFWGNITRTKYPVRTDGKATTKQRVLYYNITLPEHFKKPLSESGR